MQKQCVLFYDSNKVEFKELLARFFSIHDPTGLNRQGNDIGTQYRNLLCFIQTKDKKRNLCNDRASNKDTKDYDPILTEVLEAKVLSCRRISSKIYRAKTLCLLPCKSKRCNRTSRRGFCLR